MVNFGKIGILSIDITEIDASQIGHDGFHRLSELPKTHGDVKMLGGLRSNNFAEVFTLHYFATEDKHVGEICFGSISVECICREVTCGREDHCVDK
jgi:hypothetical protein